jgi:hypothetical protein
VKNGGDDSGVGGGGCGGGSGGVRGFTVGGVGPTLWGDERGSDSVREELGWKMGKWSGCW